MIAYVSLLRGINVSGKNIIKMVDLKALFESLGLRDVVTYIQSGNVLFKSELKPEDLVKKIHSAIQNQFNLSIAVQVLSVDELQNIYENNPFLAKQSGDISKLHVTFLAMVPDAGLASKIIEEYDCNDEFIIYNKAIYVFCPGGYGRTKLNNNFFESKLKTKATTRNWKTIAKFIDMV